MEKVKKPNFENKDSLMAFERQFDVVVSVLSKDEQLDDVLNRKLSGNYLNSPYKCDMCYKGYMSAELLKKHLLSQHDEVSIGLFLIIYGEKGGKGGGLPSSGIAWACYK